MKKGWLTARELGDRLLADPEWVAQRDQQERERAARAAELRANAEPLLAELHEAGFDITSLWDFVNTGVPYPTAIPILLKHLHLPYMERNRERIGRALAVPSARYAWKELVKSYLEEPLSEKSSAKDGLACALVGTVTDSTMEEFISIVRDPRQGPTRVLLLYALERSKNPLARQALIDLADDPDLKKQIAYHNHQRELRERRKARKLAEKTK